MGFITFYELSSRSLTDLLFVSKRIKFGSPFALDTICSLTSYLDLKKKKLLSCCLLEIMFITSYFLFAVLCGYFYDLLLSVL